MNQVITPHPDDAHTRFHNETITFIQASTYLLAVHLAVDDGAKPYKEEHSELAQLLEPTYTDPHHYFMSRLFVAYVGAFEFYLQELITSVVLKHPKKAGGVQFKLVDILDAGNTDALIRRAIDELLNKLMYKKPMEYRDELADLLSIDPALLSAQWPTFVEAKARRDLGVHADWKCNSTYVRKLHEAGVQSTLKLGESAVPNWDPYSRYVSDVLYELAITLTTSVREKHWS